MSGWFVHFTLVLFYQVITIKAYKVTGGWGEWGDWSSCSVSCGYGSMRRSRHWIYGDGEVTNFTYTSILECWTRKPCPIDGKWAVWTAWSPCKVMCGGGNSTRTRLCNSPKPSKGGKQCIGKPYETNICNNATCPDLPLNFDLSICNESYYMCESGRQCVSNDDRCDELLQCHDGTDERDCFYFLGINSNSPVWVINVSTVIFYIVIFFGHLFPIL